MRTYEQINVDVARAIDYNDSKALFLLADEVEPLNTKMASALACFSRGRASYCTGHYPAALEQYSQALLIYTEIDNSAGIASTTNNLGVVHAITGQYEQALEYFHKAIDLYQQLGEDEIAAGATGNIGNVYRVTGEYPRALEYFRRALSMHTERDDKVAMAISTSNIGAVYRSTGDYPTAVEYFRRALRIYTELQSASGISDVTASLASVLCRTGDLDQAMEYYQRALVTEMELDRKANVCLITREIASLYLARRDLTQALDHYRRAANLEAEIGLQGWDTLGGICTVLIESGDYAEARRVLNAMDELSIAGPEARITRSALHGQLCELDGDVDGALTAYTDQLEEAQRHAIRASEVMAHRSLRDLAKKRNDFDAYIKHNDAYLRITEDLRGQTATRKLAMLAAEDRIDAERAEKEKHKTLLYNTLPPSIADRVLRGEQVNDSYENAAVLFMDLVGFTKMSSTLDPNDVVQLLSEIFTTCDAIVAKHGLMKIKTIGDSYMAVAFPRSSPPSLAALGASARNDSALTHRVSEERVIPSEARDVVLRAANAALEMLDTVSRPLTHYFKGLPNGLLEDLRVTLPERLEVRIGLHMGSVTAGVLGKERLQYDVWGDTVNVASRMESTGEPGRIHVSEQFATFLASPLATLGASARNDSSSPVNSEGGTVIPRAKPEERGDSSQIPVPWSLRERGAIEIKGKGRMTTFWLESV